MYIDQIQDDVNIAKPTQNLIYQKCKQNLRLDFTQINLTARVFKKILTFANIFFFDMYLPIFW